ncbi:hypothetical protein BDZ89DRAFT_1150065 [Hymenopellis radicata]|nr:hypothetical protein BDZ89DRAFT_1150065 [Hymenopellis radicata]
MPVTRNSKSRKLRIISRPHATPREKIFGFLVSRDKIKQHPLYARTIARHPAISDEEKRERFEGSAIVSTWAFQIQPLWHKTSFEMTPYGPIIALAENRNIHAMRTPSPEIIESMQKLIEFDVRPNGSMPIEGQLEFVNPRRGDSGTKASIYTTRVRKCNTV